MNNERREFSRVRYEVEATLELGGELFGSEIVDLSLRGALVNTAASPRKGQQVALRFRLPQDGVPVSVRCTGTVVRADTRGLGVQFDEVDLESFQELLEVVKANSVDPDEVEGEFSRWLAARSAAQRA